MSPVAELGPLESNGSADKLTPLHVLDLPQLYTHPSFEALSGTLELLKVKPTTFASRAGQQPVRTVHSAGIPRYLSLIISSNLSWLKDDVQRERIWDSASARLSERSGRTAMPSMNRTFCITDELSIHLFEPSLTEDHLGFKTWTSSLLLAQRLPLLRRYLPPDCRRILELGSGTGLVGIAAASLWDVDVVLTDLPEIVPNLQRNVEANADLACESTSLLVRALDWSDTTNCPVEDSERFSLIIAADAIYTQEHPPMLVDTVVRWLRYDTGSRFIVELPLREGYHGEREDLKNRLANANMELVEEGTETGYDDWESLDGNPIEVECWWSVWRYATCD